jgi:hypothetical protein
MFAMLFLILVFAGALWVESANEFKAPPARVVPIPDAFELLGGDTDGGSGGTTVRWVYLRPPVGVDTTEAVDALIDAMKRDGWAPAEPLPLEGVPSNDRLGLLRRSDEWAGISSSSGVNPWTYELLDLATIEEDHGKFLVVELGYSDFGVGRWCLICN